MNDGYYNCEVDLEHMSEVQSVSNLKNLAKKANLSGVEIAKQMGFAPETVSRHLNGRQKISIDDAIKYGRILNCSPEEILFKRSMCPIIGETSTAGVTELFGEDESKRLYLAGPYNFTENHAAIFVPNWFSRKQRAICVVPKKPIIKNYVHDKAMGHPSIISIKNYDGQKGKSRIVVGFVFENADFSTYTVRRMQNVVEQMKDKPEKKAVQYPDFASTYSKAELNWATPTRLMLYDPEAEGFEIITDH